MACIYKRGKTWSYSVDLGRDESGKRKKKGKGGFRTQKEAKEAAAILEAELANGVFIDEKKITFGELANQWFAEHSKDIKPTTQLNYKYAIKRLLQYFDKSIARNITKIAYQRMLNDLFEQGFSNSVIRSIHLCANLIFRRACQYDILKSNPTQYAKLPKPNLTLTELKSEVPKYFEKEDLHLFLKTVRKNESYYHYVIFFVLAYTGIRRSELSALKWDDINFTEKTININKNIYLPKGNATKYILQTPKTKTSKRIIPVTDAVLHELSQLRLQQKQEKMRLRLTWHDGNFVFTARNLPGYPVDPSLIFRAMKRNLKRAGLNHALSPHSLRHTHTSLLAEAGVSLEAIMERLGHANDAITRTIYLHITKGVKKDAAQKFQELMNGIDG